MATFSCLLSSKMNSFDDTLVIAAREGNLQNVEYLVHQKGYEINATSYKNKVKKSNSWTTMAPVRQVLFLVGKFIQ